MASWHRVLVTVLLAAFVSVSLWPASPAVGADVCDVAPVSAPCAWFGGDGIRLEGLEVDVTVKEQVAQTSLRLRFVNEDAVMRQAELDLPLPPHATLTGIALHVNGSVWHGIVAERAQARDAFEDAKDRGEDAILLEAADDDRVTLSVNTPAGERRTLQIEWIAHVPLDAGARTYRFETSRFVDPSHPIDAVGLSVRIDSAVGVSGAVFPGVPLKVTQQDARSIVASRTMADVAALEDLVAVWAEDEGAWVARLVRSAPDGDAAWLLTLTPGSDEAVGALPRDIVFVLDTSGSMEGPKILQARESLREVLLDLRPDDRFGIVLFSSEVETLTEGLQSATTSAVSGARSRLAQVQADGSTDFDGGLQRALEILGAPEEAGRVPLVIMLSDGLPTAGETREAYIVNRMEAANVRDAAVHVLAIGLDADGSFLEDVAARSGGSLTMLRPDADLQATLEDFYATLQDPILTDVTATFSGLTVRDVYPKRLPPLYADGTLRLLFRANATGAEDLTVRLAGIGPDGADARTFRFDIDETTHLAEVEAFWGQAYVADLLSRHRDAPHDKALQREVIDAAITYGIVTPYTSWVVTASSLSIPPTSADPLDGRALGSLYMQRLNTPTAPTAPTAPAEPIGLVGDADASDDHDHEATPGPALVLVLAVLAALCVFPRRPRAP